ncbi:16S rRNA (adenine(1518)-N(6)/adenine(1519)-N(6))-dimethyltransferase RsmA [Natroniella sulfidigena]|uniref:16S rRNA (adenine(1518)-N(6)/adenine(1519)-N(6))- dimethyltransferase RsmA n=1 Tax=Natroniella sulfidigena TaxID=723921 RepID=UPI00200AE6EF|nr:16S rRNA (adenine(1518)-N(6)/adenine(1519)-N(6))-dimethyltransferase RsmA [Natroniella sulfidigena]MCK8817077.1 16S rRNA (adenine(1518)-N(6)/adenine(1519)-N(6))-dimethyltransferase RsmA [Natroniella sulfidigena]
MEIAKQTREILRKHDLRLKKGLGQNFLVDTSVLDQIVEAADLSEDETVVEIGPGIGALTEKLAQSAGKVIAVELDQRLIPVLEENLSAYNNVEIVEGDALEVDFDQLAGGDYKVVANLPYYITTPILRRLLEEDFSVTEIFVMVQKEVAERMAAEPGDKSYGVLSFGVQYYTEAEIEFIVPSSVFIPQPKVQSAVIGLRLLEQPRVEVIDEEFFFKVIRASFQQRRKMIRNSLSKAANINLSKEVVEQALEEVGIDSRVRGEKLNLEEFAKLSNQLYRGSKKVD